MRDTLRTLRTSSGWTGRTLFDALGCEPNTISPNALLAEIHNWRDSNQLLAVSLREQPGTDSPNSRGEVLEILPQTGPGASVGLTEAGDAVAGQILARLADVRLLSADSSETLRRFIILGGPTPARITCLTTARRILENRSSRFDNNDPPQHAYPQTVFRIRHDLDDLSRKLRAADLEEVFKLECDLIAVTHAMQARGIRVDRDGLRRAADTRRNEMEEAVEALRASLGDRKLNPNDNDGLLKAIRGRGVELPGTSREDLLTVNHPAVEPLLRYRQAKAVADDAEECLRHVGKDGRLHPDWDALGADTGRYSCARPALQSLSRDSRLRRCLIPNPGNVFVRCDFAAADLRPLAHLSQDKRLIETFRRGEDIHRKTAAALLDKSVADVTAEDRKISKLVIFAVVYDVTQEGLCIQAAVQHGLEWTPDYARNLMRRFFELHPGLADYRRKLKTLATTATESRSIALRRRKLLPPGREHEGYRFRCLLNMPAQGTVADAVKRAMVRLHQQLPPSAWIVANLHDELVVEAPAGLGQNIAVFLECTMSLALQRMIPSVPVKAEAKITTSLGPE